MINIVLLQGFEGIIEQMKNLKLAEFAKVLSYEDIVAKIKEATDDVGISTASAAPVASATGSFEPNKSKDAF